MSHPVDDFFDSVSLHDFPQRAGVDASWSQEHIGDLGLQLFDVVIEIESTGVEDSFSDEAVAIGVDSRGGESEQDVTGPDCLSIDQFSTFDDSDAEPGHVEVRSGVQVGHDRRFAAQQCGIGLQADQGGRFP